jgi:hypothetical protein
MTVSDVIDGLLLVTGVAGFVGSLMGQRPFINESRMETLSGQVGRKTIRWIAALGYLFLGVVGAARLLG